MQENKDQQKLYSMFQSCVYISILLEIYTVLPISIQFLSDFQSKLDGIFIYQNLLYSKIFTVLLILVVTIGTKAKKKIDINTKTSILLPIFLGIIVIGLSIYFSDRILNFQLLGFSLNYTLYGVFSFIGMVLIHSAFDNVSKVIKSSFMKDRFNIENESFEQSKKIISSNSSVNLPIQFYYKKKVHSGWMNIVNVFRGTLVLGTPGSGKTYSIIIPFIKQLLSKGFTMLIYDYKFPDMTEMSYFHYLLNRDKIENFQFHLINLTDVEYSRRVNPLRPEYIETLADAVETAETLIHSLQKSDKQSGSEKFFTQSAVNFLSAVIYFFAKFENGKYSTFAHVLHFVSQDYEDIFNVLYSNDELEELLSPFKIAYDNKTFQQLDGQIGTAKIFLSQMASKESAWVFSGDDIDLKLSDPKNPSIIVVANEERTQSVNSASNALILNRISKLINTKGNLPSAIVVDESPTIYFHKIEKIISTARSRKVAVLLGIQELPQLQAGYGKEVSEIITSVIGNIISGAARKKETLQWLQQLFGKIKQKKEGLSINRANATVNLNEQMDFLIPESKIANLGQGEVVAKIVGEEKEFEGNYDINSYNCKVKLNDKQIAQEAHGYKKINQYYNFGSLEQKNAILKKNYSQIKNNIKMITLDHK